ncbi:hypothetical protein Bmyc01_55610 [Bacillus mycoides]|uniref:hypothetical protein n=1 Tax=Bacillus TaxID=1386 RepID=UPI0008FE5F8A|nr:MULTISPECIES: hypothetical protein [Bacillus]MED1511232.1 hypothetical protein [Bacillus proteolyticus]OJD57825.1 hypothetical protein BAU27_18740 [Bacillus sp. NH11B]GLV66892.1 hypothetical protein Bmyc01_55610 [Bacillus mycoides]
MGKFSLLSIVLMFAGILLFGLNWIIDGYSEPIVLFSFISFLVGIVLSFIAVVKREKGTLKFISLISYFVVMFLITWFEPFQVIRIITWLKNVS